MQWQWDNPSLANGAGLDQQYFASLFSHIQTGRYGGLAAGTLDTQRAIFSGFSDGSQMASWLVELQARRGLPAGVEIAAWVMLSGGSHRCYFPAGQGAVSCVHGRRQLRWWLREPRLLANRILALRLLLPSQSYGRLLS